MAMIDRYRVLVGRTHKMEPGCGRMYVTFNRNWDDAKIIEVFTKMGKAGGCKPAFLEGVCRCATRGLRYGVPPEIVKNDIRGIMCEKVAGFGPNKITSCCDAIGKALESELEWEKTEDFQEWWKEQRKNAGLEEAVKGTEVPVHGAGRGENQEVCDGQAGSVHQEVVDDARTPVEKEQGG